MFRTALAAIAIAVFLPTFALAQGTEGIYIEARGGASFLTDSELDNTGLGDVDLSFETGYVIEGAVGYAHGSGFRGELAIGYRENDFDEVDVGSASADLDGDISAFTTLVNGYYDFNLGRFGAEGAAANLTPFIGAGIGLAVLDTDGDLGDEDDTVFAYQAIAGISYAFTPSVAVTMSYNYLGTSESDFDGIDADYNSHNVMAGLRFTF